VIPAASTSFLTRNETVNCQLIKQPTMKSTNHFLILIAIVLLSFSNSSYGQEDRVITLNVNTAQITNQNEYQVSYFAGQEENTDTRNFTIYVNPGDRIIWQGISSTSPDNDIVNIKSINYEGGTNVFDQNVLNNDRESPGIVIGVVKNGTEGFEEKYKISFTVFNNGVKRQGTFHIDPKIKVNR